jgi:hypothetical protein
MLNKEKDYTVDKTNEYTSFMENKPFEPKKEVLIIILNNLYSTQYLTIPLIQTLDRRWKTFQMI